MSLRPVIKQIQYDTTVLRTNCCEVTGSCCGQPFRRALRQPGHYTVKVEPLAVKEMLGEFGCYYYDTLPELHCTPGRFVALDSPICNPILDMYLPSLPAI